MDFEGGHRKDRVGELWATGMPLGMMPGTHYEEHEAMLAPGESLLFYTDGLVEAHSPSREMFGFPRLKTVLETQADGASLIDVLLGELNHFTGEGSEQEDDVTLVTLQRMLVRRDERPASNSASPTEIDPRERSRPRATGHGMDDRRAGVSRLVDQQDPTAPVIPSVSQ